MNLGSKYAFAALAALAALGAVSAPAQAQSSVVVGDGAGSNGFPFGAASAAGTRYAGEYQQVYTASSLAALGAGPFTISSVAFQSRATGLINYTGFTYGLYYTTATPSTIVANYAANKGAVGQAYTGPSSYSALNNGTFDFVLPTSFVYDPSLGNLLLDVNIGSESGLTSVAFASGPSTDTGRVFNTGGNGVATVGTNTGLQTKFSTAAMSTAAVPEPSTVIPFAFIGVGVVGLAFRARRRSAQTA